MQNEFDSPDESEWDEEEPYYDWDDPDWREDWDDETGNMGGACQVDGCGECGVVVGRDGARPSRGGWA